MSLPLLFLAVFILRIDIFVVVLVVVIVAVVVAVVVDDDNRKFS